LDVIYSEDSKVIKRVLSASIIASVVGLQLGSLGVVFETYFSYRTDLPLIEFLGLMQGIHLLIGIVEGVITAVIVKYLLSHNSQTVYGFSNNKKSFNNKGLFLILVICTVVIGGGISLYASSNPDGLEWSLLHISRQDSPVFLQDKLSYFSDLQHRIALFPKYELKTSSNSGGIGTSISGIVGSSLVFIIIFVTGLLRRKRKLRNE